MIGSTPPAATRRMPSPTSPCNLSDSAAPPYVYLQILQKYTLANLTSLSSVATQLATALCYGENGSKALLYLRRWKGKNLTARRLSRAEISADVPTSWRSAPTSALERGYHAANPQREQSRVSF